MCAQKMLYRGRNTLRPYCEHTSAPLHNVCHVKKTSVTYHNVCHVKKRLYVCFVCLKIRLEIIIKPV